MYSVNLVDASGRVSFDLIAVVPGYGFGTGGEGFVRLSYATSEENIKEGLRRIREFVSRIDV